MSCSLQHCDGFVPGCNIRTDLALEANEIVRQRSAEDIPGVKAEASEENGIVINRVSILTPEAGARLGKPVGNYVTIEAPELRKKSASMQENISQVLARELEQMSGLGETKEQSVLVIGLGNWNVTPDSLGPKVVEDLLVTRHIFKMQGNGNLIQKGFRRVAAVSPGVMGLTGVETGEIVQGIAARVNPDMIIAVDALASSRMDRLHTTIQLADTGVIPGSGVKNERMGINQSTMGIPVIAIGVPTVVEASTIAGEAMDALVEEMKNQASEGESSLAGILENMDWNQRREMVKEVLGEYAGQLMVTPKEIDTFMDDISLAVAGGLNSSLHPGMAKTDADKFLQ